jgi:Beta-propeller repeat
LNGRPVKDLETKLKKRRNKFNPVARRPPAYRLRHSGIMIRLWVKIVFLVIVLATSGGSLGLALQVQPYSHIRDTTQGSAPSRGAASKARLQMVKPAPLAFEPNYGQTDKRVKFVSRGNSYQLFLTQSEAVLVLSGEPVPGSRSKQRANRRVNEPAVVRLQFIGANPEATPIGLYELPAISNYLIGKDASRWHTNIPQYQKVRYRGLYPGIDLIFYGNRHRLEFDFIVAPGADPKVVRLRFNGADRVARDSEQGIVLNTGTGDVRLQKPVIFQVKNGVRKTISGDYRVTGQNVTFAIDPYDDQQTLVIDPVLEFSTYLGGRKDDYANAIAVDDFGYAYVTGTTLSSDFPVTPGAVQVNAKKRANAFVAKIDPASSNLIYTTYLGGGLDDRGLGIAVDRVGNVYIAGTTYSKDFPVAPGALQPFLRGNADIFVTKLDAMGAALIYSTYLGGSCRSGSMATDVPAGIHVDGEGNAYLAGYTSCRDFPTTPGAYQVGFGGGAIDAFVTKLDPTGSALVYSTYLGGKSYDYGNGIALDGDGNVYVTGATDSPDYPTTAGAFQAARAAGTDAFVTKLNATGSALVYSTYLGGKMSGKKIMGSSLPGFDWAEAIAVDDIGNAYVTGETDSQDFPVTPGVVQPTYGGGSSDAFVAKLGADGTMIYSTYLGGRSSGGISGEAGLGIAADSAGNAYVTGHTNASDFPITTNAFQVSYRGKTDALVVKLNPDGSSLIYSSYLGGKRADHGYAVALDIFGNAYVAGATNSKDFPTQDPLQPARRGSNDAFLVKISE